jgi:hypothetical protein
VDISDAFKQLPILKVQWHLFVSSGMISITTLFACRSDVDQAHAYLIHCRPAFVGLHKVITTFQSFFTCLMIF